MPWGAQSQVFDINIEILWGAPSQVLNINMKHFDLFTGFIRKQHCSLSYLEGQQWVKSTTEKPQ